MQNHLFDGRGFGEYQFCSVAFYEMFITLEPHAIFWSNIANICKSTFANQWHAKPQFWIDEGLLSIIFIP